MRSRKSDYVSPFVADALYRARLRSQERKQRVASRPENEWDNAVAKNGLFDPSLKKQELFKIQPRQLHTTTEPVVVSNQSEVPGEEILPRMTRRRQEVIDLITHKDYLTHSSIIVCIGIPA
jgi:hypothetical protein